MKKIMYFTFLTFLLLLTGCDANNKDLSYNYALVHLTFNDSETSMDTWVDEFFNKNEWSVSLINKYDITNTVILSYSNKDSLMEDFDHFTYSLDYTDDIYIYLITVNKKYVIDQTSNKDSLKEMMTIYENTEIKYSSISFEKPYLTTKEILFDGSLIIDNYLEYQTFSWKDLYIVDEDHFNTHSIIIVGGYRSSSHEIIGIDKLLKISSNTLEVALDVICESEELTEDIQYFTTILSVKKNHLNDINRIKYHFHTTYLNGFISDIPFHNVIDEKLDNFKELYLSPPILLYYNEDEEINFEDLYISLIDDKNQYLGFNLNYTLNHEDLKSPGIHKVYVSYEGFTKSFEIEVIKYDDSAILVYSSVPTVSFDTLDDGYIDDYETYLKMNLTLDLAIDESFFEEYSLYLLRYDSSDTNLFRKLLKHEVIYDRLHLYIHKPLYLSGRAITSGQLVFKIKKELRNLSDHIEFVEEYRYDLKEDSYYGISAIDPSVQYSNSKNIIKSEIKGYVKDSLLQYPTEDYVNRYFYKTYEEFIKDYNKFILDDTFDLNYFDNVYFGRKNLLIVEAEIYVSKNGFRFYMPYVEDGVITFIYTSEDGPLIKQKILIFKNIDTSLIDNNAKVKVILRNS